MEQKEALSKIMVEESMLSEFNKMFSPPDVRFTLTYPVKLNLIPNSESRFKDCSNDTILRALDINRFVLNKIRDLPSFIDDDSWNNYCTATNNGLKAILKSRGVGDESLLKFESKHNKRIKLWADNTIKILDGHRVASEIGLPFFKIWDDDSEIRANKIYIYESEQLTIKKRDEELKLDDFVYENYRGGSEKDKSGIREFDSIVYKLLKSGGLITQENLQYEILPATNMSAKQVALLLRCSDIVKSWGADNAGLLTDHIYEAVERIDLHYERKSHLLDIQRIYRPLWNNPGILLDVGLILTEKTRDYLYQQGKIHKAFIFKIHQAHPDFDKGQRFLPEASVIINAANKILSSKENFARWLNGYSLFEV